jgi:hypothetical protein
MGVHPRTGTVVLGSDLEVKHQVDYTIFGALALKTHQIRIIGNCFMGSSNIQGTLTANILFALPGFTMSYQYLSIL